MSKSAQKATLLSNSCSQAFVVVIMVKIRVHVEICVEGYIAYFANHSVKHFKKIHILIQTCSITNILDCIL